MTTPKDATISMLDMKKVVSKRKGTLYEMNDGNAIFEAKGNAVVDLEKIRNNPQNLTLVLSDGAMKHYTTKHKHVFYISVDKDSVEALLVGAWLPKLVNSFIAKGNVRKLKFYVKNPLNPDDPC